MSKISIYSANICREYQQGCNLTVLADRYSCSIEGVAKLLEKNGIKRRKQGGVGGGNRTKGKNRKGGWSEWSSTSRTYRNNHDSWFEEKIKNPADWVKVINLQK